MAAWFGRFPARIALLLGISAALPQAILFVAALHASESAPQVRDALWEIGLFGALLAGALATVGTLFAQRLVEQELEASTEALHTSAADFVAAGEVARANEANASQIYALERKAHTLTVLNQIYQATNFQAGIFEILSRATDTLIETFLLSSAILYRKAPESSELATIFLKKRLPHSGQIVMSRELTPLFLEEYASALPVIEAEARNAIATGQVQRAEITRGPGLPPYQAAVVPVILAEGATSALCFLQEPGEYFFTEADVELLENISSVLGQILEAARQNDTSLIDSLTRLYNYRQFLNQLSIESMRARRNSTLLTLLAIEIDDFRRFAVQNDHRLGEAAIRETGALIRSLCRSTDFIARKEGSLFFVLLPETAADGASVVVDKILKNVAAAEIKAGEGTLKVSVSIGAAIFPLQAMVPNDLLSLALEGLANAKAEGGNRAAILKTPDASEPKPAV